MEKDDVLKRIDELLMPAVSHDEKVHATISLLSLVYGAGSPQLVAFTRQIEEDRAPAATVRCCTGVLRNLKREIEAGLIGNLRQQITGEVLADLIQLSRIALSEQGEGPKNVAAVLAAAAFEDAIRRVGRVFAGVVGRDDLSDVLKQLKDAGVVQGTQVGIAQSYLNFRNSALHANWDRVERESILSVLGFTEQLLMKHFT